MSTRLRHLVAFFATLVAIFVIATPVAAHGTREVADYSFVVGFMNGAGLHRSEQRPRVPVIGGDEPVEGLEEMLAAEVS